jgi:hypothetical protein
MQNNRYVDLVLDVKNTLLNVKFLKPIASYSDVNNAISDICRIFSERANISEIFNIIKNKSSSPTSFDFLVMIGSLFSGEMLEIIGALMLSFAMPPEEYEKLIKNISQEMDIEAEISKFLQNKRNIKKYEMVDAKYHRYIALTYNMNSKFNLQLRAAEVFENFFRVLWQELQTPIKQNTSYKSVTVH